MTDGTTLRLSLASHSQAQVSTMLTLIRGNSVTEVLHVRIKRHRAERVSQLVENNTTMPMLPCEHCGQARPRSSLVQLDGG